MAQEAKLTTIYCFLSPYYYTEVPESNSKIEQKAFPGYKSPPKYWWSPPQGTMSQLPKT